MISVFVAVSAFIKAFVQPLDQIRVVETQRIDRADFFLLFVLFFAHVKISLL
jgi:hypothetical protein